MLFEVGHATALAEAVALVAALLEVMDLVVEPLINDEELEVDGAAEEVLDVLINFAPQTFGELPAAPRTLLR